MIQTVIEGLALLTLISNLLIVAVIIIYLFRNSPSLKAYWAKLENLLIKRSFRFALTVSLVATLGSLFLSDIAKFEPCLLCWYQRIFMYPLVLISGIALWKKTKDAEVYILPMSIIGGVLAAYHYYLQTSPAPLAPCKALGYSVSCTESFVNYFGYITVPWMSLSAFTIISGLMLLVTLRRK